LVPRYIYISPPLTKTNSPKLEGCGEIVVRSFELSMVVKITNPFPAGPVEPVSPVGPLSPVGPA
jgi:hypothetical protein